MSHPDTGADDPSEVPPARPEPGIDPSPPEASGDTSPHPGVEAAPVEDPALMSPPPAPELLAPGVERMQPPAYAAKKVADPTSGPRPSAVFLAVIATASLVSDVATKLWAEKALENQYQGIPLIKDHLTFILAKNKGGAWGLLQGTPESVRRPFFLLVSVAAVFFIVPLYQKLTPKQHALRWGLPLVLGGALGNVFDRVRYGFVIDFIDYQAVWVRKMNELVQKRVPTHIVTDHWPTFNVADIAICVGVVLMALDMFTSKRGPRMQRRAYDPLAAGVDAQIAAPDVHAPPGAEGSLPSEAPHPVGDGEAQTDPHTSTPS